MVAAKTDKMGRPTTSVMKKIIHYMQEQALHPSPTLAYLAPSGKEPQQVGQHRSHHHSHRQTPSNSSPPSRTASPRPNANSGKFPLPSDIFKHQYASDSILQSYTAYIPPLDASHLSSDAPKYFVIYLHGGYYRDPKIDASSFDHTLSLLLNSPLYARTRPHISGYASINYRLSPHPDHPQDPDRTSKYEFRNASHPQHIEDVVTAIADLQQKYGFGSHYILMGHSVGATLALEAVLCGQVPWTPPALQDEATHSERSGSIARISPPTAMIGLNGIYSFPLIHTTNPSYEALTSNALSSDPAVHRAASPASYPPSAFSAAVSDGKASGLKHVILAASKADKLVPWSQVECMRDVFAEDGETDVEVRVVEVKGDHDDCWKKGEDVARVVGLAVKEVIGTRG